MLVSPKYAYWIASNPGRKFKCSFLYFHAFFGQNRAPTNENLQKMIIFAKNAQYD